MTVLSHSKLRFGLPVLGLWLLGTASAAQLDVTPTPVADSIPEGTANYIIKFHVQNNTGNFLLLDYALAVITHGPPDRDDFINFSGKDGAGGLVSAPTFLPPFGAGDFKYSVTSPDDGDHCAPGDCDPGVDPVSFSIEMQPFFGNPALLPAPNDIFAAVAHGFYFDLTPVGTVPQASVLAQVLAGIDPCAADPACAANPANPPNADLLYPNANPLLKPLLGISTVTGQIPTISTISVFDTPEPSTWTMMSVIGLGAIVAVQRKYRRSSQALD